MMKHSTPGAAIVTAAAYLLAMAGLLIVIGYYLLGTAGLVIALGIVAVMVVAGFPSGSTAANMLRFGAMPLDARRAPWLYGQVVALAGRAGVRPPALFLLRSPQPNAMTMGTRDAAALLVTDTLLTSLNQREVRGVLAHEIAHIQANDVWLSTLAGTMRRFTGTLALVGGLGLLFALPALARGTLSVSLPLVVLMFAAPTLSGLLHMALARSREFNADRAAAALSGDPRGLASALLSLQRRTRSVWELMFGYRVAPAQARLTDSHPPAQERVARLLALDGSRPAPPSRARAIPVRVG